MPAAPTALPPLRYLSAADVTASMPDVETRLALAERTMRALVADAELPPKIAVHPRPAGSFAHAMPAFLRGTGGAGGPQVAGGTPTDDADGLGMKWVTGFPDNGAAGLPSIAALVILNDPATGLATAILDGGPITAQRTAAVSGVAIRAFAPRVTGRPTRIALIGAGTQARSHLPVLGCVLPGSTLSVFDRHPERADEIVALAGATEAIAAAVAAPDARSAVDGADVVLTMASFGPTRQVMTTDWVGPETLVVAVDYATYVSAELASSASLFIVDDRRQFLANRDAGNFDGYPDPGATLGEALIAGTRRPAGRVVVSHLGVGLADVIFGRAILAAAERAGRGTVLPR